MKPGDHIDAELLRELQGLAAISLSEEQALALRAKLQRVVAFLAEIDAVEIPDPAPEEPRSSLRGDLCGASLPNETVMQAAPRREGPFFCVLPVLPPLGDSDPGEGREE